MPKPVLLTVDDDPEVLRAIERDLRSRYSDRYRVMRANSGSAGLATLRELKARNNPVALLLADQRMPQMDGVNFLSEAMEMHPLAKRALLTAYADTNAAIDAINEARRFDLPTRAFAFSAPAGRIVLTNCANSSHGTRCPINGLTWSWRRAIAKCAG